MKNHAGKLITEIQLFHTDTFLIAALFIHQIDKRSLGLTTDYDSLTRRISVHTNTRATDCYILATSLNLRLIDPSREENLVFFLFFKGKAPVLLLLLTNINAELFR